jgi:hypothetical protein
MRLRARVEHARRMKARVVHNARQLRMARVSRQIHSQENLIFTCYSLVVLCPSLEVDAPLVLYCWYL